MSEETKEVWAVVELMGHVRLAGRLTEEERFGSKMGRLDIPQSEPCICGNGEGLELLKRVPCDKCGGTGTVQSFITQFFGGGAVYRITIVSEEVARHVVKDKAAAPVSPWKFPKQLARTAVDEVDDGFVDNESGSDG